MHVKESGFDVKAPISGCVCPVGCMNRLCFTLAVSQNCASSLLVKEGEGFSFVSASAAAVGSWRWKLTLKLLAVVERAEVGLRKAVGLPGELVLGRKRSSSGFSDFGDSWQSSLKDIKTNMI